MKVEAIKTGLLLFILFLSSSVQLNAEVENVNDRQKTVNEATTSDLNKAIGLAEKNFSMAKAKVSEYTLIEAKRLLSHDKHCASSRCWYLTFKQTRLIPDQLNQRIGAGGELFFIVDLDGNRVTFIGHGE